MRIWTTFSGFVCSNLKWIAVAGGFTFFGLALSAVYASTLDYVSTLDFCAHTCHEMEATVYQEYTQTKHFKNEHGVVVTCAQCHVPHNNWPATLKSKVLASFELWNHFVDQEYKLENFNPRRPALAEKVWAQFAATNARECKACHQYSNMVLEEQRPPVRAQHEDAMKIDQNCLDCHKGITHDLSKEQPASANPAGDGFDLQ